jgi:hypothetical protein
MYCTKSVVSSESRWKKGQFRVAVILWKYKTYVQCEMSLFSEGKLSEYASYIFIVQ